MKRKIGYKIFITIAVLFIFLQAFPQSSKQEMQKLVDENLQLAVKQYKHMQKLLPADKLPRSSAIYLRNQKLMCHLLTAIIIL